MANTVHFETLGCRLNQDETEGAARCFADAGFTISMENLSSSSAVQADAVLGVINTCTVTGKAEQKARRIIRLMLEKLPQAVILVTGCYAELDAAEISSIDTERICVLPGTRKFLLASLAREMSGGSLCVGKGCFSRDALAAFLRQVHFVPRDAAAPVRPAVLSTSGRTAGGRTAGGKAVGGKNAGSFAPATGVRTADASLPPAVEASAQTAPARTDAAALQAFTLYTPSFERHSRASVKIQDGCNNACSFCRIHLARGKSVSLPVAEVLRRVQELERRGVQELVFTGVNLSQYSGLSEDGGRASFAQLLDVLLAETDSIRFRVSSFYPQHITEELCSRLASPRVQPSFHLSVQSGSDRILALMRRPYCAADVLHAVELLRRAKSSPFISCDIIAGFPGESESDFAATRELCRAAAFAWIHAFPYSPRPATPAYSMKPQIPERVKGERVRWLTETAVQGKLHYIASFVGKTLPAVAERSRSQRVGGELHTVHAVTDNFLHVECRTSAPVEPGSAVSVRIEAALEDSVRAGREIDCLAVLV